MMLRRKINGNIKNNKSYYKDNNAYDTKRNYSIKWFGNSK